jgi:hypothetical protein
MLVLCAALAGCVTERADTRAVCVLVDVSGTYADQKTAVVEIIKKGILPDLRPGDSLTLMRIDSKSFEDENIAASLLLDDRPSQANTQKVQFAKELDVFASRAENSRFTDVRGCMMLAADQLRESKAKTQMIITFSDMREELPKGVRREFSDDEFAGIHIVAVNVKRLDQDNADPSSYRKRIESWENIVMASGALDWRVIADGQRLAQYLDDSL